VTSGGFTLCRRCFATYIYANVNNNDNGLVAQSEEQTFDADPETERMLLESIAECDRGQTIPIQRILDDLRSRE
jgi:hypothetical protein